MRMLTFFINPRREGIERQPERAAKSENATFCAHGTKKTDQAQDSSYPCSAIVRFVVSQQSNRRNEPQPHYAKPPPAFRELTPFAAAPRPEPALSCQALAEKRSAPCLPAPK